MSKTNLFSDTITKYSATKNHLNNLAVLDVVGLHNNLGTGVEVTEGLLRGGGSLPKVAEQKKGAAATLILWSQVGV